MRTLVGFVVAIVILYFVPFTGLLGLYLHDLFALTFMFMAVALAWNWLGGYVGQISFGHAAMFGVGGFVAARLILAGVPAGVGWVVGGLTAGAYALVWGHPTLRLRGPYFSIATIGVLEASRLVATYWTGFTGGSTGLSLPVVGGMTKYAMYWYGLYILVVAVAMSYWLRKSRIGLGLVAIRDDVEAAADIGVNQARYQDVVLFLSGSMVGVCGGFYASYYSYIVPSDMFGFERSISFILLAVIGGIGTILGPIFGAVVFVVIQEFLLASYPDLYLGLYGFLLICVILFEPRGISGLAARLARLVRRRDGPRAEQSADTGVDATARSEDRETIGEAS